VVDVVEAAPVPSEPQLVDVWRPARFDREHGGRHARRGKGDRKPGDRASGERGRGPRRHEPRPEEAQATGTSAPAPEGQTARPYRHGDRKPWQERDGEERPRGEKRFDKRSRDGKSKSERMERGDRPPQREDRGGPRQWSSGPPQTRSREPDPNSPFAQLAALKAKLESAKP
jgi:ATP-dependent RNA helicase SUPV3L1/SUV3